MSDTGAKQGPLGFKEQKVKDTTYFSKRVFPAI